MSTVTEQPITSGAAADCPRCGETLRNDVDGLCPRCLLGAALGEVSVADPDAPFQGLPRHFGRFTIVRQLGQGAMGAVFLADDAQLQRRVAIKVPLFGSTTDSGALRRFEQEVRSAASLRHPNLCPIHDVGEVDGIAYMTMAYIDGQPLSTRIERGPPLTVRQTLVLIRKIALGVLEAHRHGIIHRDLKPSNIMLDRRGEPIVMDFGLARLNWPDSSRLTQSGMLVGTPAYMAPEQISGADATERSDIYSLGVMLFELLTQTLPFSGDLVPLLAKIAHEEPRAPSRLQKDVPPAVDAICLKALAKQPWDRFLTMDDFAGALTHFFTIGEAVLTAKVVAAEASASRSAIWHRRAKVAAVFAGGVLLGMAALLPFVRDDVPAVKAALPVTISKSEPMPANADRLVTEVLPNMSAEELRRIEAWLADRTAQAAPKSPLPMASSAIESQTGPVADSPQPEQHESPATVPKSPPKQLPAAEPTDNSVEVDEEASLFARAMRSLAEIDVLRRRTQVDMDRLVTRRDVGWPQAVQHAAAERDRLRRESVEIELTLRKLNTAEKNARRAAAAKRDDDARARLEAEAEACRRDIGKGTQLLQATAGEFSRREQELTALEAEKKARPARMDELHRFAQQLLVSTFWSLEPSGSLSRSEYLEIADVFSAWLPRDGADSAVLALRAIARAHAGHKNDALADARRAATLDDSSGLALAALGFAEWQHEHIAESSGAFARGARVGAKDPAVFLLRGLTRRAAKELALAIDDFRRVVELAPDVPWGHALLAEQLAATRGVESRDVKGALEAAQHALDLSGGGSWFCWAVLAAAQAENGQFADAVKAQRQAIRLAPAERQDLLTRHLASYNSKLN